MDERVTDGTDGSSNGKLTDCLVIGCLLPARVITPSVPPVLASGSHRSLHFQIASLRGFHSVIDVEPKYDWPDR